MISGYNLLNIALKKYACVDYKNFNFVINTTKTTTRPQLICILTGKQGVLPEKQIRRLKKAEYPSGYYLFSVIGAEKTIFLFWYATESEALEKYKYQRKNTELLLYSYILRV